MVYHFMASVFWGLVFIALVKLTLDPWQGLFREFYPSRSWFRRVMKILIVGVIPLLLFAVCYLFGYEGIETELDATAYVSTMLLAFIPVCLIVHVIHKRVHRVKADRYKDVREAMAGPTQKRRWILGAGVQLGLWIAILSWAVIWDHVQLSVMRNEAMAASVRLNNEYPDLLNNPEGLEQVERVQAIVEPMIQWHDNQYPWRLVDTDGKQWVPLDYIAEIGGENYSAPIDNKNRVVVNDYYSVIEQDMQRLDGIVGTNVLSLPMQMTYLDSGHLTGSIYQLIRLYQFRFYHSLINANQEQAWADIMRVYHIYQMLKISPNALAAYTWIAVLSSGQQMLEVYLNHFPIKKEQAEQWRKVSIIDEAWQYDRFVSFYRDSNKIVFYKTQINAHGKYSFDVDSYKHEMLQRIATSWYRLFFQNLDYQDHQHTMEALLESRPMREDLQKQISKTRGLYTRSTIDGLQVLLDAYERRVYMHKLLEVGIALRLYEQTNGAFPQTLERLTPIYMDKLPAGLSDQLYAFDYRVLSDGAARVVGIAQDEHRYLYHYPDLQYEIEGYHGTVSLDPLEPKSFYRDLHIRP